MNLILNNFQESFCMKNICLFLGAGSSVVYEKPTTLEFRHKLSFLPVNRPFFYNDLSIPDLLGQFEPQADIEEVLESLKNIMDFHESKGSTLFNLTFPRFFRSSADDENEFDVIPEATDYRTISYDKYTVSEEIYLNTFKKLKNMQIQIYKQIFAQYRWNEKHNPSLNKIMSSFFSIFSNHDISIATTNYDQAFETFCDLSKSKIQYIDGFELDASQRFIWTGKFKNSLGDTTRINYYKLHGSLDWKKVKGYGIVRTKQEDYGNENYDNTDCLIYPTISPKEGGTNEPFKSIFDKFKETLKKTDLLIIVGFSFRDLEITKLFKEFSKSGKQIVIVNPSFNDNFFRDIIPSAWSDFQLTKLNQSLIVDNIMFIRFPFNHESAPRIFNTILEFFHDPPLLNSLEDKNSTS